MSKDWFLTLGKYWLRPFKGAEALSHIREIPNHERNILILVVSSTLVFSNFLTLGGSFASIGGFVGAFIISMMTLGLGWAVSFAGMLAVLQGIFHRMVVPQRLFLLIVISSFPSVFIFPFMIPLAILNSSWKNLIAFIGSLLSLLWLWESLRIEYSISRGKAFFVVITPALGMFFTFLFIVLKALISIGLQGLA